MKKGISVLVTAILMISLTACGDVSQKMEKQYQNLTSYTAQCSVTVYGNKGPMNYEISQSYLAPDCYFSEVIKPERMAGTAMAACGEEVWVRGAGAPAMPLEANTLDEEMDVLFPIEFLKDFFGQEPLPTLTENQEGQIPLAAPRRGNEKYRFSQQLFVDAKEYLPISLVTYDTDGNEVVRVEYHDVKPNIEIDKKLFSCK